MALDTLLLSWFPLFALILPLIPFLLSIYKWSKPSNLPPGPRRLPILGNLHQLGNFTHRSALSLSKIYGPILYLQLGNAPTIIVSSAKMAKEAMKTQDVVVCSRPAQLTPQRILSYNFLDVAFCPYGQNWRDMRKCVVQELLGYNRILSTSPVREEEIGKMLRSLNRSAAASEVVNLSELLLSFTTNLICRTALGKLYQDEEKHLKRVLHEAGGLFSGYFIQDLFPWLWWVDVLNGRQAKLHKVFSDLDAFYERVISEHEDPKRANQGEEDFVDVLLKVKKDMNLTPENIKAVLMNVLFAASDSTATVVEWTMAELVKNPRFMKRIQDEVRGIMGKTDMVKHSDLHQFHYLKAAVKESLRVHPPGTLIPRETLQKTELGGYEIPINTRVFINNFAISRDPETWENPEKFLPERFLDNPIDYRGQDFEFLPFGAGRRVCPGMHLGVASTELLLANLVYFFNWELPDGMKPEDVDLEDNFGVVVNLKVPLRIVPVKHQ